MIDSPRQNCRPMIWASTCGGSVNQGDETMRHKANGGQKGIGVNDGDGSCPCCQESIFGAVATGPGTETFQPCGCQIATDGHGNLYDVDGEREGDASLERRATIEEHDDGGIIISDGGAVEAARPRLNPSDEEMLLVLYETGGGVRREIAERFAAMTGYSRATTSGVLSRLEQVDLVGRRTNLREPDANIWNITSTGRAVVENELLSGEGDCGSGGRTGVDDGDL